MPPSRYAAALDPQQQWEPGSRRRVLRNLRGIRSVREMDRIEARALAVVQWEYFRVIGPRTRFTAGLIRQMHRDWLGEIYPWAGHYRTVELAKDEFHWPPAIFVPSSMRHFGATTLRRFTPCKSGSSVDVGQRLAVVHAELLLIHPFRDGNGRIARWVAAMMAAQAGWPFPNEGFVGKGGAMRKRAYLDAVRHGYVEDYEPLTRFFAEALERARQDEAAAGRGKPRAPSNTLDS